MAADPVQVGDVGVQLVVRVLSNGLPLDVSAMGKVISLQDPQGNVTNHAAANDTDGTDGRMVYVTVAGDIDAAGTWFIQGKVTQGTSVYYTATAPFPVFPNLPVDNVG